MARRSSRKLDNVIQQEEEKKVYSTAVYVRLSIENSGKDDDGASIETQKKVCLEYLDLHSDL